MRFYFYVLFFLYFSTILGKMTPLRLIFFRLVEPTNQYTQISSTCTYIHLSTSLPIYLYVAMCLYIHIYIYISLSLSPLSIRSVPRLGLRFGSLRPTFVIYDYNINRNIYRCIWTWLQQACTCVTEMIIRTFSFNHMNKKMLQRITTVFQLPWRRVENVSGTVCKLLEEYNATY